MATSHNTIAASANEVSKINDNANEQKQVKTLRVLETREQWAVIFNHAVMLVATLAKGERLPDDPRKGFAFGKTAEQPHSRQYAQSLIGGFVSRKANKFFAQTVGLQTIEERTKIALAILTKTKLGTSDESKARSILSKAEPKQVRTFAEAVLNEVQVAVESAQVALSEQKSKSKGARKGTRKASNTSK